MDLYHAPAPLPQLMAEHTTEIGIGPFEVLVTADGVPVEGALVGVFQYDERIDGTHTDATGLAVLDIDRFPAGTAPVEIAVTSHNCAPYFGEASALLDPQGVGLREGPCFALMPARPNPCRGATVIEYTLPRPGHARLDLFDPAGRLLRTLRSGDQSAGCHNLLWDGRGKEGAQVPAGIYLCRLTAASGCLERRCVVLSD
jgi:hypothetical protein